MASQYIPDGVEEAFFERYFEYGDDEETVKANATKAIIVLKAAYDKAEGITTSAEDGECFDETEAVLVFQTLSLAYEYAKQFVSSLSENDAKPYREVLAKIVI